MNVNFTKRFWGNIKDGHIVTERVCVGLTACCLKASKQASLVERKICFNSVAGNCGGRVVDICPKADSLPSPLPNPPTPSCQQPVGQEILQVEGGDYMQKQYMALTVIFKLVIWVVLGIVNLHFQGLFVPISLRPILGTVAARVLGTAWSLCS